MNRGYITGIVILLAILAIILFGGIKSTGINGLISPEKATPEQKGAVVEKNDVTQATDVRSAAQIEKDKGNLSQYNGLVNLSYVNRSTDPANEYVTMHVSGSQVKSIPVTGWILKSTNSGETVIIPKGTYLYFTGMTNSEDNINLASGDTLYLITGQSPIGVSFKINKCSGYQSQFQTFVPYINNKCPLPKDEDLKTIPKIVANDACFDYIDSLGQCRTQTDPIPVNWSYECKDFLTNKLSYSSCVNTHKNDSDFNQHEWRVYLKRSASVWKDRRENIVLYDNLGKVVDTLTY